jgi:hypothetical protein
MVSNVTVMHLCRPVSASSREPAEQAHVLILSLRGRSYYTQHSVFEKLKPHAVLSYLTDVGMPRES